MATHESYLGRLIQAEISDREQRAFAKRLKDARLPSKKTFADFEFSAMQSLDPVQVHRLAEGRFIEKAENVLLVGGSGTGKTHLATAISIAACKRKHSGRVMLLDNLADGVSLEEFNENYPSLTPQQVNPVLDWGHADEALAMLACGGQSGKVVESPTSKCLEGKP